MLYHLYAIVSEKKLLVGLFDHNQLLTSMDMEVPQMYLCKKGLHVLSFFVEILGIYSKKRYSYVTFILDDTIVVSSKGPTIVATNEYAMSIYYRNGEMYIDQISQIWLLQLRLVSARCNVLSAVPISLYCVLSRSDVYRNTASLGAFFQIAAMQQKHLKSKHETVAIHESMLYSLHKVLCSM